jgi:DNA-nicking Smr family endonuclease
VSRRKPRDPPPPGRFRPFEDLEIDDGQPGTDARPGVPVDATVQEPAGDEELFLESVEGVTPLGDAGGPPAAEPRPARLPDEEGEWRSFARDLLEGNVRFDITWSDEFVEGRTGDVSEETMQELRRGAYAWQDHLDLHGMTRQEARESVDAFIERARRRSMRCVLIVHGRGKGSEGGLPVLKEKLVAWLARRGGLGSKVLAFTSARPCDGGTGAMYVLLRA